MVGHTKKETNINYYFKYISIDISSAVNILPIVHQKLDELTNRNSYLKLSKYYIIK